MTVNQRLAQIASEHVRLVRGAMTGPLLGVSERLAKIEPELEKLRNERDELLEKYPRNQRYKKFKEPNPSRSAR